MYHFAIVALFGLAILKIVDLLEELVPGLDRIRTLATFALAVTATVAVDYSMFDGFGITLREAWMGTWATGLVVGSLAGAWNAVLGYLGSRGVATPESRPADRPRTMGRTSAA